MIICTGSERPIRQVLFNREDDLLFAASVDGIITLWNPETGERMGTYKGHRGAVNAIAVDYVSKCLISAGGDGTLRIWNVMDGAELKKYEPNRNALTSVDFACGDKLFLGSTLQLLGNDAAIHIYRNPTLNDDSYVSFKMQFVSSVYVYGNVMMQKFCVCVCNFIFFFFLLVLKPLFFFLF